MFTGLVEEIAEILSVSTGEKSASLTIKSKKILEDVKLGDSIAVNGVCLTVTSFDKGCFTVDVMPETMRKSNLGKLVKNSKVNLERAMQLGARFGGHIVSGHIDGIGKVINMKNEDIATWVTIGADFHLLKYIVMKGSVTIDGISLTVAELGDTFFKVSLIPHTKEEANIYEKKVGDEVNIECDIVGKYIERLLFIKDREEKESRRESRVTEDLLKEYGFM
ncbi:riboflavin synthase [Clostridium thailandense]|uniref:riboflavin synthase n=1 Tax=Clostridium thailandense TaxID=2794346 RepID=UPI00398A36E3